MIARRTVIAREPSALCSPFGPYRRSCTAPPPVVLRDIVRFASKHNALIKVNPALIGVAHIIRRHIIGEKLANQMLKRIAIGLGNTNRFQRVVGSRAAPPPSLERLARRCFPAINNRVATGMALEIAVQRGLYQTIEFTTIRLGAQTTSDNPKSNISEE